MEWPAYSPDLNPIENLELVQDRIHEHYPQENISYNKLREVVKEAYSAVRGEETLHYLLSMWRDRCPAVIDANGMHSKG